MSKRLVAVGDQNGIREHERCCPKCGRFGLKKDSEGGAFYISGGNVCSNETEFFYCPTCDYEGDGKLEELPEEEPENSPFGEE